MRKFLILSLIAAALAVTAPSCAFADAMVPIAQYKCLTCGKNFYAFDGDPLESLNDPDTQLKRVFRLDDRGKNFDPCNSSSKAHVFALHSVTLRPVSQISKNISRIAIVRGGPKLNNITMAEWTCLNKGCGSKWPAYTLNEENLMIKDWERQSDKIFAIKGGRAISKCQGKKVYGHAFPTNATIKRKSVTSYEIATVAYDLFYVKD